MVVLEIQTNQKLSEEPRQDSRKSCALSCLLALCFSNFFSLSLPLFCSLLRSLWYEHISHSLSSSPSPSLPQDCCFIKQTLPIFHLPLSPPCSALSHSLFLFILSFAPPNTHITPALHVSMHCSAVISVYTFQFHLYPLYSLFVQKTKG